MATVNMVSGRWFYGTNYSGYKIKVFEPGTSTPKSTYPTSALTPGTENTHPVVLDANGSAAIWFSGNAKVIFYTPGDVEVYSIDNVNLTEATSTAFEYNLAINFSFEDDADGDGIPDSWSRTLFSGGAFAVDTTTQNHGQKSVKFTSTGTGGGYITSNSSFAVRPSTPHTLTWDMKSSVADVRNVVEILWFKADGTASATASSTAFDDSTTNPTSWTQKTFDVTSPSDAYFAKLRFTGCHSSDATAGSTWFDTVKFVRGVSAFADTLLDDLTAAAVFTTLGIENPVIMNRVFN